MPSKEDIYLYIKAHDGAMFKVRHLVKIFDCRRQIISSKLQHMYSKKKYFPGIDRKQITDIAANGRVFICYGYFIKSGDSDGKQ